MPGVPEGSLAAVDKSIEIPQPTRRLVAARVPHETLAQHSRLFVGIFAVAFGAEVVVMFLLLVLAPGVD